MELRVVLQYTNLGVQRKNCRHTEKGRLTQAHYNSTETKEKWFAIDEAQKRSLLVPQRKGKNKRPSTCPSVSGQPHSSALDSPRLRIPCAETKRPSPNLPPGCKTSLTPFSPGYPGSEGPGQKNVLQTQKSQSAAHLIQIYICTFRFCFVLVSFGNCFC